MPLSTLPSTSAGPQNSTMPASPARSRPAAPGEPGVLVGEQHTALHDHTPPDTGSRMPIHCPSTSPRSLRASPSPNSPNTSLGTALSRWSSSGTSIHTDTISVDWASTPPSTSSLLTDTNVTDAVPEDEDDTLPPARPPTPTNDNPDETTPYEFPARHLILALLLRLPSSPRQDTLPIRISGFDCGDDEVSAPPEPVRAWKSGGRYDEQYHRGGW